MARARPRLRSIPTGPAFDEDEAAAAREWLENADDAFLACRGNHNFPKIRLTNGALPGGVHAAPQADGGYQLTVTCPDCGTTDTFTTIPGGWIDGGPRRHSYDWPEGYRMPKGAASYVTARDCQAEVWRRVTEVLAKPARPAKAQPRRRRSTRSPD
jgi:hypothetical protein